ncbi:MAG: ubiquinol-cytochrome C chaperone family protein [Propylenella sp.]
MLRFSSSRRAERDAAARLYAAALAASRRPGLYLGYGVPDTPQGRFEMLTLHLFPVLHRLMHKPGDDPALARRISESFVRDMDGAFREMGLGDLSVPKRMRTLYGAFAGRIAAYQRAIGGGDGELAAAIARNVFPDRPEERRAAALADYIAEAVAAVQAADIAAIRRGETPFPDLSQTQGE